MNVSPLLLPDESSSFQTIFGVMRCMVELGRIDTDVEVSQVYSFLAMSRQGHLVNALHIMSYLKIKHNSRLVLDTSYPGMTCLNSSPMIIGNLSMGMFRRPNP